MEALKTQNVTGDPQPLGLVGGEDIPNAFAIPGLPYTETGNTCDFQHDYDETCPFVSIAPDVVYSYAPVADGQIDVSLCQSGYDTKVYIYENDTATLVACNDDRCGSDGFRSEITQAPVTAGNTYYVVVDGYDNACGEYALEVAESPPNAVVCPGGAVLEGEPDCHDGYVDDFNGGCNSDPPVFASIPCAASVAVCGTYGGFFDPATGFDARDTDWYHVPEPPWYLNPTICVTGEIETLFGYLDPSAGCAGELDFLESAIVGPYETICFSPPIAGIWVFVAPASFGPDAGPCGSSYIAYFDDCCEIELPTETTPTSWGAIKEKYAGE
jgi:hypothetical protein